MVRVRSKSRALVVFAHPVPGSFTEAIRERVSTGLLTAGWTVDVLDLYQDHFNPLITAAELAESTSEPDPQLTVHIERVAMASALVFVYPAWWGGQPAILKGWLDRMTCCDEGLTALKSVRRLVVVSPHGSSRLRNAVQGVGGRRIVCRHLRSRCRRFTRCTWVGFYNNDRADSDQRREFLDQVHEKMSRLAPSNFKAVSGRLRRLRGS